MGEHTADQVDFLGKGPRAQGAVEGTLAHVDAPVPLQLARRRCHIAALPALWPFRKGDGPARGRRGTIESPSTGKPVHSGSELRQTNKARMKAKDDYER